MTENSLVERLESCPFCGKSAQGAIYSCARISVYCECGARGPSFWTNGSTDAASADYRDALVASEQAWNRRAPATTIAELRGQVERAERELDAVRKESAKGFDALADIDEAWDAFGSGGNRKVLTLAEQISSQARELDDALAQLAAAERALASKDGVQVKALEWDNLGYAHVPFEGRYYVGVYRPGQWEMRSPGMEDSTFPDGLFCSEDAAKAAAQADYDRRIRSALTTPPPAQDAPVRDSQS